MLISKTNTVLDDRHLNIEALQSQCDSSIAKQALQSYQMRKTTQFNNHYEILCIFWLKLFVIQFAGMEFRQFCGCLICQWASFVMYIWQPWAAFFYLFNSFFFIFSLTILFKIYISGLNSAEIIHSSRFVFLSCTFTFSHFADAFIQSDLQMMTIEAIKTNKQQ